MSNIIQIHKEIKTSNPDLPVIELDVCINVDNDCAVSVDKYDSYGLTKAEIKVLKALEDGDTTLTNIAKKMHLSRVTINHHMQEVRRKLNVKTNIGAVIKALKKNIITLQ